MIYGYGRVSTKGQAKDGNSLEAQERLLKEHGAEIIYMDSFTGTKMTRPEFDKLLKKLKAGDTLVVAKLDRFARSVSQASDLITKLIDEGVRVDVCNLGILDNSSMSIVSRYMSYIVRGTEVFGKIADAMDVCFSKEPLLKMPYFSGIMEVLQALNIAISGTDNQEVQGVDTAKVKELVSAMRQIFKLKEEVVKIPEKNMQETLCIRNKSTLSMEEKISKAEEEYSNFDKPKEMTMYAVNLDYLH